MFKQSYLAPLHERRTPAQLEKRAQKMRARSTVAAQLLGQQKMRDYLLVNFINMGVIARVRWVQFGTSVKPIYGNLLLAAEAVMMALGVWWAAR